MRLEKLRAIFASSVITPICPRTSGTWEASSCRCRWGNHPWSRTPRRSRTPAGIGRCRRPCRALPGSAGTVTGRAEVHRRRPLPLPPQFLAKFGQGVGVQPDLSVSWIPLISASVAVAALVGASRREVDGGHSCQACQAGRREHGRFSFRVDHFDHRLTCILQAPPNGPCQRCEPKPASQERGVVGDRLQRFVRSLTSAFAHPI